MPLTREDRNEIHRLLREALKSYTIEEVHHQAVALLGWTYELMMNAGISIPKVFGILDGDMSLLKKVLNDKAEVN